MNGSMGNIYNLLSVYPNYHNCTTGLHFAGMVILMMIQWEAYGRHHSMIKPITPRDDVAFGNPTDWEIFYHLSVTLFLMPLNIVPKGGPNGFAICIGRLWLAGAPRNLSTWDD